MSDDKKIKKTKSKTTTTKTTNNNSFWWVLVVGILIVGGLYFMNKQNTNKTDDGGNKNTTQMTKVSSKDEKAIKKLVEDNKDILFSKGAKLTVNNVEQGDGVIVANLSIDGDKVPFYLTKNKKIILQVISIEKITKGKNKVLAGVNIKKNKIVIDNKLKEAVTNFVNTYLIQGAGKDVKVDIGKISQEDGLIKIDVSLQGKSQPIYLMPSGSKVALQVITLEDYKKEVAAQEVAQKKAAEVSGENKTDKPQVDIFVMSYCPYGTQFEKGVIPVLRLLKDKIDAKIRFVNYAMHNKKEIDENIVQYCIQKNTPDKLYDYLDCFLEKGNSKECVQKTAIDADKLASCSDSTDKEFKITDSYNDKSTWKGQFPSFAIDNTDNEKYGVGGSPTLVINGQKIQPVGRDASNLLKTVCSGFKNQPKECQEKLSTKSPSSGFGSGSTSGSTSGSGCTQ